ncbi:MAG TPA: heme-binding protein [Nitrososphaerales archaeon]|nr:heme-binding protein [Nitrososphaerales archaeon]
MNRGFRIIADYIFGNNARVGSSQLQGVVSSIGNLETIEAGGEGASEKIAMTAPVLSEKRDANDSEKDRYNISFVMPSKYSIEALPVPRDERVRLREVKKRISAAVRFSGYATEDQVQTKYRQLRQMLAEDEVSVHPGYQVAQYNPPWTPPFMRRNEVLIDVAS